MSFRAHQLKNPKQTASHIYSNSQINCLTHVLESPNDELEHRLEYNWPGYTTNRSLSQNALPNTYAKKTDAQQ